MNIFKIGDYVVWCNTKVQILHVEPIWDQLIVSDGMLSWYINISDCSPIEKPLKKQVQRNLPDWF